MSRDHGADTAVKDGKPGSVRAEIEKVDAGIERVDGVLLETLGDRGSMLTAALSGAGIGLALGDVPGAVIGLAIGIGLGAAGARGRSSGS